MYSEAVKTQNATMRRFPTGVYDARMLKSGVCEDSV